MWRTKLNASELTLLAVSIIYSGKKAKTEEANELPNPQFKTNAYTLYVTDCKTFCIKAPYGAQCSLDNSEKESRGDNFSNLQELKQMKVFILHCK